MEVGERTIAAPLHVPFDGLLHPMRELVGQVVFDVLFVCTVSLFVRTLIMRLVSLHDFLCNETCSNGTSISNSHEWKTVH